MDHLLAELRGIRAATGIRQVAIAHRMEMDDKLVSKILSGERPLPADFECRFRAAVAALATEKAQAERDAADARARAILGSAGVVEQQAEVAA